VTTINSIADYYYENTVPAMSVVKAAGITHIIHKCTEHLTFTDSAYAARRADAVANEIKFGAYHFGRGGDPIEEAKHFLANAKPDADTLIALDLEQTMTLAQAEAWVQYVHDTVGRWPYLYTGYYYLQEIGWTGVGTLANCRLWLAAYDSTPLVPKGWDSWTLHQYTNGSQGPEPRLFPGLRSCDRSEFRGTIDELNAIWAAAPTQSTPQSAR
jgi:lysozyme